MSQKKLSFGFTNKIIKKINVIPIRQADPPKSVQLIDCLEGQTIKIKDAVIEEKKLLIIPIQSDDKNLVERVIAAKKLKERSKNTNEVEIEDNRPDSELSLDELAARQLIREAKGNLEAAASKNGATKVHVVPAVEDTLILEGSKEPTLNDYENVPIGDYGLAMLRGMGWSEKTGIGKDKKSISVAVPELRPKGMGLGAYKMVEEGVPKKAAVDKEGKELCLVKGACAKIIAGKEKGFYCKVEGLDDEGGRIIVKMAIKGTTLSLNEFMLCPVTQEEYSESSRILNNSKYRDFQEKEAMSSDQANLKNNPSNSQVKTEIKREIEHKIKSRSPDVNKNENRFKRYEKNIKKEKDRSRSRSFDKKKDRRSKRDRSLSADDKIGNKKNRKYKSKSRSPSYHKSDKNTSKYRSRSRSAEKYDRKQKDAKKHQSRRSRSSSLSSPPRSSNKYSKNRRSRSPKSSSIDYSKDKLKYSKVKRSSSSSTENIKLEKTKKYSDSESDYDSKKRDKKNKKLEKKNKNKKKKSSKKYDNSESDDGKQRSHSKKKRNDSSKSESSDDVRYKEKSSKRR